MTKYKFYKRTFLNKPKYNSGAHIIAEISVSGRKNDIKKWRDGSVVIADCNRSINLDFSMYDSREFKNSLEKLDTILSTLTEFRDILVKEGEELKKEEELSRKSKGKKK